MQHACTVSVCSIWFYCSCNNVPEAFPCFIILKASRRNTCSNHKYAVGMYNAVRIRNIACLKQFTLVIPPLKNNKNTDCAQRMQSTRKSTMITITISYAMQKNATITTVFNSLEKMGSFQKGLQGNNREPVTPPRKFVQARSWMKNTSMSTRSHKGVVFSP